MDSDNFMRLMPDEETIDLPLREGKNTLIIWLHSDDLWQQTGNPPILGRMQAMKWGLRARME